MSTRALGALAVLLLSTVGFGSQAAPATSTIYLHAHNCYPDEGQWTDRLSRALDTGVRPLAIEQDLVWAVDAQGHGRSVVSHGAPLTGREPSLEEHFFTPMLPLLERALRDGSPPWQYVLHLDFKTNEPAHHQAIWELLGKYERFIATAERTADPSLVTAIDRKPLLVLTEAGQDQQATFYDRVPVGSRLRLFGTVPPNAPPNFPTRDAMFTWAATVDPAVLIPSGATNYRRWTNHAWAVVERGGQAEAGAWTMEDAARLRSIVTRAHTQGLLLRFYTLNGHAADASQGWSAGYNFGSLDAVRARWRAAIDAGVNFIATDQYEEMAKNLRSQIED